MNRGRRALLTFVRHRGPVVVHSPHRDRDLEFKDKTPSTMLGQHSLIYSATLCLNTYGDAITGRQTSGYPQGE